MIIPYLESWVLQKCIVYLVQSPKSPSTHIKLAIYGLMVFQSNELYNSGLLIFSIICISYSHSL